MASSSLTYSTELMQNYLQAEILAPDARFEALPTDAGTSLLFSIGTDQTLYVTKEVPGARSGWGRFDLSSAQIAHDFSGQSGVTCKDFASAQSAFGPQTSIHVAMVVSDAQNDHLYLSLQNSGTDTNWTAQPSWTAYPFDDPAHPLKQVKIARVLLTEATDSEYVVVDVLRDPSSAEALVYRYYIDPAKSGGHAWHPHDLAIDLEAGTYSSCLGRRYGQYVDGLYTAGQVGGVAQFTYQPLFNAFNPSVPASPSKFELPGGTIPDAIAACRNADNSSDLYITAGQTLYHLGSHQQQSGATPVALFSSPLFTRVRSLFAAADGSEVMVWGLNADDQVFYTTCSISQITGGSVAWSVPLPILSGVEQVSPYLDRANSANTFFAHTGQNELTKATKSPGTSMWAFRSITLDPPATTTPAQRFTSYTTRVQVTGADGQPASGATVSISASNVTSVHVNSLYYVIGPAPIQVAADAVGVVTVVEPVQGVDGTRLTVAADGAQAVINPMDKAVRKATSLTTTDALTSAVITNPDGTTKPLVPSGTSTAALKTVAAANAQLAQAYASVPATPPGAPQALLGARAASVPFALASGAPLAAASSLGSLDSVLVDAGDLFSWLGDQIEKGVEYVVKLVVDPATRLWNFVVKLADQAYHCVLDCVEKVASAAQWLYAAIKTAIADLLKFLAFLFEWGDIKRTKKVLHNVVKLFLYHEVEQIEVVRRQLDQMVEDAEKAINGWAGVGDWSGLGADGSATANSRSTPSAGQTAPGSLLAHHFQANANGTTTVTAPPAIDPSPNPITVLIDTLEKEADTIGDAIERLREVAANIDSTPVDQVLVELVAIIADLVLESAKNVADAVLDVLYDIAKAAVDALATPIHIPVVSDILSDIGVPEFSFLDVVCWIAAVPITILYKATTGRAPFPDDPETAFLIGAPDYDTLVAAFAPPAAPQMQAAAGLVSAARGRPTIAGGAVGPLAISPGTAQAVHVTGHCVSGFCSLVSAVLDGFEAAEESGENPWGIPSAVCAVIGGVTGGAASALVPYDPIQDPVIAWTSRVTLGTRILCKLIFSGPAQKKFSASVNFKSLAVSDGRGVGAIVDSVLVVPGLACSCWHFYELSEKPAGATRSIAIVDETSALTADIARVSYAVAVNTEDIPKAVAIGVMVGADVCTGGLQFAEALIS